MFTGLKAYCEDRNDAKLIRIATQCIFCVVTKSFPTDRIYR